MKAHQIAAIVLILALTASGYVLTVWQHTTLSDEEQAHEETSGVRENNETSSTDHTGEAASSSRNNQNQPVVSSSVTGAPLTDQTQSGSGEDHGESTSTSASNAQSDAASGSNITSGAETESADLPQISLTVISERVEQSDAPLVTLQLQVSGEGLDLSGWRLGDDIGVAGHPDHLFYFGDLMLSPGDTLTIHSGCGRDAGLTLYWCLSQPLTLLDSARKDLYLLDQRGQAAVRCRPEASGGEQTLSIRYKCV